MGIVAERETEELRPGLADAGRHGHVLCELRPSVSEFYLDNIINYVLL